MSAGDGYRRVLDAARTHGLTITGGSNDRQSSIQCPAHDDGRPSLSVTRGESSALLKCHAGCGKPEIVGALGLTMAELFDDYGADRAPDDDWMPCGKGSTHRKIEEYPYRDETGRTLYTVARCDHKCFAQWTPDPSSKTGKRWRLGNTRRLPYRLPELLAGIANGDTAWIVEGERDVHAIAERHSTVTCNSGGAGKWQPEFTEYFTDADVVIVADRDGPGHAHALLITEHLIDVVNSLEIVQSAHGKDARDHFAGGGHLGNFVTVATPRPWTEPNEITARMLSQTTG